MNTHFSCTVSIDRSKEIYNYLIFPLFLSYTNRYHPDLSCSECSVLFVVKL